MAELESHAGQHEVKGHGQEFLHYVYEYDEKQVAEVICTAQTMFDRMKEMQEASGHGMYHPFADWAEWELAEWLITNVNQWATDEFLKLLIVSKPGH